MKCRNNLKRVALVAIIFSSLNSVASAATWVPLTAGPHSWNVDANWAPDPFPNSAGAIANLAVDQSVNQTVNLNVPITVGSLTFGDTNGAQTQTIAPNSGSLILDNAGNTAILARGGGGTGATTISAPITLVDNVDVSNSQAGLMTISGVISGLAGLSKSGTQIVALSGLNTYTGNTVINGGTLRAVNATAIPSGVGKGEVIINGGTLNLTAGLTTNAITQAAGTLITGAGSIGIFGSTNTTFGGSVQNGTGNVTNNGTGTVTFNAAVASTFTGRVRVNNLLGKVVLDYSNLPAFTNLVAANQFLQGSSGTIEFVGKPSDDSSQTFSQLILQTNTANDNTLIISPGGGSGTMTLTFTNPGITRSIGAGINFVLPASGGIINGGGAGLATSASDGLLASNTAGGGAVAVYGAGAFSTVNSRSWATVSGGNIAELDNLSYSKSSVLGMAASNYNALSGTASNVDIESSVVMDAPLDSGNGALGVSTLRYNTAGATTLTLQGTNYLNSGGILVTDSVGSNATTITGGTLIGRAAGFPSAANNLVGGPITTSDLIVHQYNQSGVLEIASQISDNGALITGMTKLGAGTLKVSNANNDYNGTTYVAGGTLLVGAPDAIPHGLIPTTSNSRGAVVVASTLDLGGNSITVNGLLLRSTAKVTSSVPGAITFRVGEAVQAPESTTGASVQTNFGSVVEDGAGTLAIEKLGALNWLAASPVTYSGGTTLTAGTAVVSTSSTGTAGPLGTGMITLNGGTLTNDATGSRTVDNALHVAVDSNVIANSNANFLVMSGAVTGSAILEANSASAAQHMYYVGDISGFTGTFKIGGASVNNRVHFSGAAPASTDGSLATFDASGTNASGTSAFRWGSPGNLVMKMGELKGTSTQIAVTPVANLGSMTLEVGHKGTSSTFAGKIAEAGTSVTELVKVGAGTLTMTGVQAYLGDTTVNGGTLEVASGGSIPTPAGNLNVGNGAFVLGGSATVQNTVNTVGTGTIHVQSTGTLTSNNLFADFATIDGTTTINLNGGTVGASKVETLTIGGSGKLNLKDNDLVVGTAANVDAVRTAIIAGKANNAASGITSDVAAFGTTTGFGYAMGNDVAISPLLGGFLTGQGYDTDSVLVKYTFLGDADLDGDSDLNDLGLWAQAFTGDLGNPANPATYWTSGDFDYDGDTDLNDLGFWAGTFTGDLGGGAGSLFVVAPGAPAGAVAALNSMGITVVPEPSTFVLAGVGLAGLAIAARRKKSK